MMNDFSTRMGAGAHLSLADEHPKAKSLHQLACDECVTNCVRCGWMGGWVGGRCVYVCVVVVVCVCGGGEAPPPLPGRQGRQGWGRPPGPPTQDSIWYAHGVAPVLASELIYAIRCISTSSVFHAFSFELEQLCVLRVASIPRRTSKRSAVFTVSGSREASGSCP